MKARWSKYLLMGLLAVASRVQAEESRAPAHQDDSGSIASAHGRVVALAPIASDPVLAVEGGSNSGAAAPAITAEPRCSCGDESGSPTTRLGTPNDGFAAQVWSGP